MNFMKEFLKRPAGSAAPRLNLDGIVSQRLPYHMSSIRWHGDSRPACAVIAVHDVLSTGKSWSPFIRSLSQLPVRSSEQDSSSSNEALTTTMPADVFAVDLRMHGKATGLTADLNQSYLLQCAADIAAFRSAYVPQGTKLHLIGMGVGAQVCALASLAMPTDVHSLTMLMPSGDSAVTSSSCTLDSVKERLQTLSDVMGEAANWEELQRLLKKRIPNEWERMLLLQHVMTRTTADDASGPLFTCQSRVGELVSNGYDLAWPAAKLTPTVEGDAVPVYNGKATLLHHGISQCVGDVLKVNFPTIEAHSVPSFGFLSNGTADVDLAARIGEAMSIVTVAEPAVDLP
jgi:pimeloyl-ACP methyl ester carboxylesterase